eukprot:CAMPEP_0197312694 /NCGR_PEP_ID=MMETSP0891-20130614/22907_1 /TAXON_ID=44058 ORGANISM="Aureoumbra lagunensis, Strain CCMP1510" /NCGR_SAMPLE_ID=MMETSP0891 /ASSEMBLY_ACC=CAM_ASM_000534 /LENGTH=408 /DNA_ID=CAMNT_0042800059 /DNA_START=36 /DNA_END=1263 /DNA_ORIENTATION=-
MRTAFLFVLSLSLRACFASKDDVVVLLTRGEFSKAEFLVDSGRPVEAEEIKRGLGLYRDALSAIISHGMRKSRSIAPAFRWAQNDTAIFLEVKFAHTLSAPAQTDASIETVETAGPRELKVLASALQRGKRFELSLRFWGEIEQVPVAAETSAGRSSISLIKTGKSAFRWPRLIECQVSMPSNSALWLDMQESLGFSDDDDEEDGCKSFEDTLAAAEAFKQKQEEKKEAVDTTKKKQEKDSSAAAVKDTTDNGNDIKTEISSNSKKVANTAASVPSEDNDESASESDNKKSKMNVRKTSIKQLKKQATTAKKLANAEFKRAKNAINSEGRKAIESIQQSLQARLDYLNFQPPRWTAFIPKRFIVHDGAWDLMLYIADTAHKNSREDLLKLKAKARHTLTITTANLSSL